MSNEKLNGHDRRRPEAGPPKEMKYDPVSSGFLPKLFSEANAALYQLRPTDGLGMSREGGWMRIADGDEVEKVLLSGHVGKLSVELQKAHQSLARLRALELSTKPGKTLLSQSGTTGDSHGALRLVKPLNIIVSISGFAHFNEPLLVYAAFKSGLLLRTDAEDVLKKLEERYSREVKHVLRHMS